MRSGVEIYRFRFEARGFGLRVLVLELRDSRGLRVEGFPKFESFDEETVACIMIVPMKKQERDAATF